MSESKINWIASLRQSVMGSAAERRREERKYLKLPIEVKVASGVGYPGFSRDLSRSSMSAVVSTHLKVGQEVSVTFEYPVAGKEPVPIVARQATVRHCLGYRYCFEFHVPLDL